MTFEGLFSRERTVGEKCLLNKLITPKMSINRFKVLDHYRQRPKKFKTARKNQKSLLQTAMTLKILVTYSPSHIKNLSYFTILFLENICST